MAEESDQSRSSPSNPRPGGTAKDPLASILDQFRAELEYLRQDRDRLREKLERREKQFEQREQQWEQREQQWEQREQQWEQREQQWESERTGLRKEIDGLKESVKNLGLQLKTQLGKVPSSEKGASLVQGATGTTGGGGDDGSGPQDDPPPSSPPEVSRHEIKYLAELKSPRDPVPESMKEAESPQEWWESQGSEPQHIPPPATIFNSQIFDVQDDLQDFSFTTEERLQLFGRDKGLHSKKDSCTVYNLGLGVTEITCLRENLTDMQSGLYYRKGNHLGPADSQISWESLARIVTLVCEYAMPMERLAKAIGHSYFSSANISRWFVRSAAMVSPVYVAIGKALGKIDYVKADDTSALVLDLRREAKAGLIPDQAMTKEKWESYLQSRRPKQGLDIVTPVLEAFGRVANRSDGKGAKISLNTSLIMGRLDTHDYRSTVYFYRTHFGQVGNLLSRIFEDAPEDQNRTIVVQGDSSPQNHLEGEVAAKFNFIYVGCHSHARRDIFRYRDRDKQLAFCLLRCFRILATIEDKIQRGPLTNQRILRYRARYSAKIWVIIESICRAVINGQRHPLADNKTWQQGDKLFKACAYILNHLDELKYYLDHPHISADNNSSERGLRGEKIIENSSHFRKSEAGRIALDIHRTLIASCNAAGVSYKSYLQYVMATEPETISATPERYFPHAVAYATKNRGPPSQDDGMDSSIH